MINVLLVILSFFVYVAIAGFTSKLLISVLDRKDHFDNDDFYIAGAFFPLVIIYYLSHKPFQFLGEYVGDKIMQRKLHRLLEQKRIRVELEQATREMEEMLQQDIPSANMKVSQR